MSHRMRILLTAILMAACQSPGPASIPSTRYLENAVLAGRTLQGSVRESTGGIPDRLPDGEISRSLGQGAAGHALFFAELYAATGDSSFLASATAAVRFASREDSGEVRFGLYDGLAGIASVAAEVASLSGDASLDNEARRLFDAVAGAGPGSVHDVLTGTAGIGLALLYAFETYGDSAWLEAAVRSGDHLLAAGQTMSDGGMRWMRGVETPFDLPNFSHGTAGVGYFLVRLAATTGLPRFANAAAAAAEYLDRIADRRDGLFLVPYGVPNDGYATPYDIGWAHGPAGTARFHYATWRHTGDPAMRTRVEASARTLLASGIPGITADSAVWRGPFRIDRRFGTSGAAMFLMDWGNETGADAYLAAAARVVDDIRQRAEGSSERLVWSLPLYGFQGSDGEGVFTGYFYGSAGLGLTLLRRHYVEVGGAPRARLPDDPFSRVGQ